MRLLAPIGSLKLLPGLTDHETSDWSALNNCDAQSLSFFSIFSLPSPLYKHFLSALYQIPKMNQVDFKNVLSETIFTQKINILFYIWNSVSRIAIRGLRWPLNCTEIIIKKRKRIYFPLTDSMHFVKLQDTEPAKTLREVKKTCDCKATVFI